MNKTFVFFILVGFSAINISCTTDDNTNNNEVYQKLIGKWYFEDPAIYGESTNNSFTFNSDNTVKYSTWASANDEAGETGTWNITGDVLTMEYPQTFVIKYVQKIVFIDENTVQFVKVENSDNEPYGGTYYKAE